MGCKLVLFSFLVTSSLVASFPFPDGFRVGVHKSGVRSREPGYYQPNSLWMRNQAIQQSTQNPIFVWNNDNYKNTDKQQRGENSFVGSENAYGNTQRINGYSYDNETPVAKLQNGYYPQWPNVILPQHTTPVPFSTNNGFSDVWWNSQRLNRLQQNNYGQPYGANSYGNLNQGNYGQGYYQSAGLITPKPVGFDQAWLPQNQYKSPTRPVQYLPWPVPDNKKDQTIESNSPNEYNKPEDENKLNENVAIPSVPMQTDGQESIVASQQPVNNEINFPKRFIIVHMNGTYEHVDNLDEIEMDESNIARIKSKEPPNNIIKAIIEIEEDSETENQMSLEAPYDTGITKIRRDTNWSSNDYEYPGMLHSYEYPDVTKATTEDTTYFDMRYFKPENIMPIQSTTENTIDKITNSSPQITTTHDNINRNKNSFIVQSTTENTVASNTDSTAYSTTVVTAVSATDSNSDSNSDSTTGSIIENFTDHTIASTTVSATDVTASSTTDYTTNITTDSPAARTTTRTTDSTDTSITRDSTTKSITSSTYNDDDKLSTTLQYSTENTYDKTQKKLAIKTHDIPERAQTFDKNYDYKDTDHTENTKYNNQNTNSDTSRDNSRITDMDDIENYFDDIDTIQQSDSHEWTVSKRGSEYEKPDNYYGSEQTSNDNDDYNVQTGGYIKESATYETKRESEYENYSGKDYSPSNEEQIKPRDDLKIDVSELKTSVKKPVVWFRPDKTLWDKVTKGEESFDAVSIYDVQCKPKLLERVTTTHHYPNGTELVEYAEIIWDSPDAVNPREITSKREFREHKLPQWNLE